MDSWDDLQAALERHTDDISKLAEMGEAIIGNVSVAKQMLEQHQQEAAATGQPANIVDALLGLQLSMALQIQVLMQQYSLLAARQLTAERAALFIARRTEALERRAGTGPGSN